MSSIGSRLREERDRLGYNQSELAELGATTRKTQFNYETDARRPDADYLAAVTSAGMDVLYVLTGSSEGVLMSSLTPEEEELLDLFRKAPDAVKQAALGALLSASAPAAKRKISASKKSSTKSRGTENDGKL